MFAESDGFRIAVGGDVPDGQKAHASSFRLARPHREAGEGVGTERVADRHVRRIPSAGDQDAADARLVVPRVEGVPAPSDIGLEPGGEIHRVRGGRDADIAEIAGAVAGRNVHAAAEGDRQVGVVAAHAFALLERLPGRSRRSRILVAERDVAMDPVADRLDAPGAGRRVAEQVPGDAGQPIGLAVTAAEQEDERLLREIFHGMLVLRLRDRIGLACIVQQRHSPTAAPVPPARRCECTSCQSRPGMT